MKDNSMYTLDRIYAYAFGLMAGLAAYGAIFKGAWWHIGTAAICAVMAVALWKDAIGNEWEEDLE